MKNYTFPIMILLLAIFLSTPALAVDKSLFFFYDDAEGGAVTSSYAAAGGAMIYNTTLGFNGSSNSIQLSDVGASPPNDYYILNTNFTSAEYSTAYCLAASYRYTALGASNDESGAFIFNTWPVALITSGALGGGTAIQWSNGTIFTALNATQFPVNGWNEIKVCFAQGYAAAGLTNATFYINGTSIGGAADVPRPMLDKIFLDTRQTGNKWYVDNLRIWNFTAYGASGPQDGPSAPVIATALVNVTSDNSTLNMYANVTDVNSTVTVVYWLNSSGVIGSPNTVVINSSLLTKFSTAALGVSGNYSIIVMARSLTGLNSTNTSSNIVNVTLPAATPPTMRTVILNASSDNRTIYMWANATSTNTSTLQFFYWINNSGSVVGPSTVTQDQGLLSLLDTGIISASANLTLIVMSQNPVGLDSDNMTSSNLELTIPDSPVTDDSFLGAIIGLLIFLGVASVILIKTTGNLGSEVRVFIWSSFGFVMICAILGVLFL